MKFVINLSDSQDAMCFDKNIPEGVSVSHPPVIVRKGFGLEPSPMNISIGFSLAVSSKVLASWIYDKFIKCKSSKITINKRTINIDKGWITQIIEESKTEEK